MNRLIKFTSSVKISRVTFLTPSLKFCFLLSLPSHNSRLSGQCVSHMAQVRTMHFTKTHNSLTGGPEAPIGPMAPVGPVSPLGPLGPRSPLAPGWPAAPCGQNRQNEELKPCRGNRGRLWHQHEESANKTHRGSSKSTGTYRTRLTTFTLEGGQRRDNWLEMVFKRAVFWTSCLWHRNNCRNCYLQGYHGHQQDQQDQQDLLLPKRQPKTY